MPHGPTTECCPSRLNREFLNSVLLVCQHILLTPSFVSSVLIANLKQFEICSLYYSALSLKTFVSHIDKAAVETLIAAKSLIIILPYPNFLLQEDWYS